METAKVDYVADTMLVISSLEEDAAKLDQVLDGTADDRTIIKTKLMSVVTGMELDPDKDSPRDTEVKMQIINAATSILNDTDAQQFKRVNVKAKLKEIETNNQHAEAVMAFLKEVDLSDPNNRPNFEQEDVDEDLDKAFEESGAEIKDTELREDSEDLT